MTQSRIRVVVLGGGIGGLAAGLFCARTGRFDVTVVEREKVIGGLCGSFRHHGFTLDYGAHKLYSVIPGLLDEVRAIMGDRLAKVRKRNRLFLNQRLTAYPLEFADLMKTLGLKTALQLGVGFGSQILVNLFERRPPRSYEEYICRRFGRPTYELVFRPLANKVWGRPDTLHPEMARTRVPASGGLEVVLKLLKLKRDTAETNAEFFYYPKKGFGDLPEAFKEGIVANGGQVITAATPVEAGLDDNRIKSVTIQSQGTSAKLPCDLLISSVLPLDLGKCLFRGGHPTFENDANSLEFRDLILVYVFVRRPQVLEDQWIFCPDPSYVFSRVFEQKQMNPGLGPEDATALCCDFTCDPDSALWNTPDPALAQRCAQDLIRGGFIKADEVLGYLVIRRRSFYPRYGLDFIERLDRVWRPLREISNLLVTGRIGMYNYNNADHCIDMGRFIAERLHNGQPPAEIWTALEQRSRSYRIVD